MQLDGLLQLGPMIGGGILLLICFVNIIRTGGISNANAAVLGVGALMFALPTLTSFNIDSPVIKVSGQVQVQGAELKRDLADIKQMVESLAKASGHPAPSISATTEGEQNRGSLVFVVYAQRKKALAQRFENELLRKGFAANAIFSDYTELDASQRGAPGSIRFVYKAKAKAVATEVKSALSSELADLHLMADNENEKMAADVEVLLF
jgi:hypothetical protein